MAQFVVGEETFTLSKADLDKHPGSLLHSLVGSVTSTQSPVSFKVEDLPDSPFATWPAAVGITTALYRKGCIEVDTLSALLHQHTAVDLYDKLKALLDYLLLPGPVKSYLPNRQQVPLIQANVLDLHYQAAADDAVQAMLSSTAFSSKPNKDVNTAVFYVSMKHDDDYGVQMQAYAVGGCEVWWKQHNSTEAAAPQVDYVDIPASGVGPFSAVVLHLPEGSSSNINLYGLANYDNSPASLFRADRKILPIVRDSLTTALSAASSTAYMPTVEMVPCCTCGAQSRNISLLVVHW